jgi:predicted ATP-grasp superfamily ATP-dependent carboligase
LATLACHHRPVILKGFLNTRHDENLLLILGASVRAAGFSALRAGLNPRGGDLFADGDALARFPVTAAQDYPSDLVAIAQSAPAGPWMYCGGLENHPNLVNRIARERPLLGNPGEVLCRVRDPFWLAELWQRAGIECPACRSSGAGLPGDGSWLRKRRKSAGGMHVHRWRGSAQQLADNPDWYFQQFQPGMACSAVYLAAGGKCVFIGATEQLLRSQHEQEDPFCYAGSLGPLRLTPQLRAKLQAMGSVLANGSGMSGLLGVDFVMAAENIWPIEVNPRYTASMEILEWSLGESLVGWHVAACREGRLPVAVCIDEIDRWRGKAILFAESDMTIRPDAVETLSQQNATRSWPLVADIPMPGSRLQAGQPVLTVFEEASTRQLVRSALSRRLEELEAWIQRPSQAE